MTCVAVAGVIVSGHDSRQLPRPESCLLAVVDRYYSSLQNHSNSFHNSVKDLLIAVPGKFEFLHIRMSTPKPASEDANLAGSSKEVQPESPNKSSEVLDNPDPEADPNKPKGDEAAAHAEQPETPKTDSGSAPETARVVDYEEDVAVLQVLERLRAAFEVPEFPDDSKGDGNEARIEWFIQKMNQKLQEAHGASTPHSLTSARSEVPVEYGVTAAFEAWEKAERKLCFVQQRADSAAAAHQVQVRALEAELRAMKREIERRDQEIERTESIRYKHEKHEIQAKQEALQFKAQLGSLSRKISEKTTIENLKAKLVIESVKNEAKARERQYIQRVNLNLPSINDSPLRILHHAS